MSGPLPELRSPPLRPRPGAAVRLFCLPYAGAGIAAFKDWAQGLPESVELRAIELPGRDSLALRPPRETWDGLAEELVGAVARHLDRPYLIFGHSMGALMGFELARALRDRGLPAPLALVVAGHRAPQLPPRREPVHRLPDAEFVAELRALQGTPEAVLDNPELMDFFLPLLRADFALCAAYTYRDGPPLDCAIRALGGAEDADVRQEDLLPWRVHAGRGFQLNLLPGGHFFIHGAERSVLEILAADAAGGLR